MSADPRNDLFKLHLEIVDILQPDFVLMENVRGINSAFGEIHVKGEKYLGRPRRSYASKIRDALAEQGYDVQQKLIKASDFGVPQLRPRYFTVGIRNRLVDSDEFPDYFQILQEIRHDFLKE